MVGEREHGSPRDVDQLPEMGIKSKRLPARLPKTGDVPALAVWRVCRKGEKRFSDRDKREANDSSAHPDTA
jgi:hypothetical protein